MAVLLFKRSRRITFLSLLQQSRILHQVNVVNDQELPYQYIDKGMEMDKENSLDQWEQQHTFRFRSPDKSPQQERQGVNLALSATPTHTPSSIPVRQYHHHTPRLTPFQSPEDVPSKLLRHHFQQWNRIPQQHRRRLVDTGARRTIDEVSPNSRIGYDGTHQTPSKELLKSTAASRYQRVDQQRQLYEQKQQLPLQELDDWSLSVDVSLDSIMITPVSMSGVDDYPHVETRDIPDPVALTLWNDGREDYEMLTQLDICGSPSVRKVASSLFDIMDEVGISTLVRPKPKRRNERINSFFLP